MKQIWIITAGMAVLLLMSCDKKVRRSPGRAYMPDMTYSRAYETYASMENLKQKGIHYSATPVPGTVAQEDTLEQYPFRNDSLGYINSKNATNPLPPLTEAQRTEAARLYLIYCGICHGEKLDGNGPLYNNGEGPYVAKPANLATDPLYIAMAQGTMFHSITYGIRSMGGYASQLSSEQRWMIVHYIKEKQGKGGSSQPAQPDSTARPQ